MQIDPVWFTIMLILSLIGVLGIGTFLWMGAESFFNTIKQIAQGANLLPQIVTSLNNMSSDLKNIRGQITDIRIAVESLDRAFTENQVADTKNSRSAKILSEEFAEEDENIR